MDTGADTLPITINNNNNNNNIVTNGNKVGSLGYCIGVSVGITLLIATFSLVSYYCARGGLQQQQPSGTRARRDPISWIWNVRSMPPDGHHVVLPVDAGLDETTIAGFPKLLYSEVKQLRGTEESTGASCCSICLADYTGSDDLRLLPDCGHLFHHKCIDPWLRSHPTCPVCRTSPFPTPVLTPFAEVMRGSN